MKKKFGSVCQVCTQYSLLLYLTYASWEEIQDTFFIFSGRAFKTFDVPKKFTNYYDGFLRKKGYKWSPLTDWMYYHFVKHTKLPSMKHAKLYSQDHLLQESIIIGRHPYTLLEDAAHCFRDAYLTSKPLLYSKAYEDQKKQEASYKYFKKFVGGPVLFNRFGNNPICTDVILTYDDGIDYLKQKRLHHVNFSNAWNTFPQAKKDFILKVFEISDEDIEMLLSKKVVIFTQPLYIGTISRKKHQEIYGNIIRKYPIEDVLIKPHPRDLYPYENDFPGIAIFKKSAPSQLFELLNISYKTVVTLFSSAVLDIKYDKLDWYGTGFDPVLRKIYGELSSPDGQACATF